MRDTCNISILVEGYSAKHVCGRDVLTRRVEVSLAQKEDRVAWKKTGFLSLRNRLLRADEPNQFSVEVFQMKTITHLLTTQLKKKKSISML